MQFLHVSICKKSTFETNAPVASSREWPRQKSFYIFSPMYFFLECSNSYLCHLLKHSIISNILPTICIFNTSNIAIH